MSILFPDRADTPVGDELDRCYTPDRLARLCVQRARRFVRAFVVLEPSVGGGAFVRALSSMTRQPDLIVGVDLDAGARGLSDVEVPIVDDLMCVTRGAVDEAASGPTHVDLVVGNPPFSAALEHVPHLRETWPEAWVAVILPLGYLGVSAWQPLCRELHSVHPIEGRPWPAKVRETALYVWWPGCLDRVDAGPAVLWHVIDGWQT